MLCPNMELAESTDESAEDITAADIAPNPINDTQPGERYCSTIGSIKRASVTFPFASTNLLSVTLINLQSDSHVKNVNLVMLNTM